jgi:hypothetical protein
MNCTSSEPIDITQLETGASTTNSGDSYGFQAYSCSGFSEGSIILTVFTFFILATVFLVALDVKIFGIKVKIRK